MIQIKVFKPVHTYLEPGNDLEERAKELETNLIAPDIRSVKVINIAVDDPNFKMAVRGNSFDVIILRCCSDPQLNKEALIAAQNAVRTSSGTIYMLSHKEVEVASPS